MNLGRWILVSVMPDIAPMAGLVTLETGPQCKKAVVMDFDCWILVSVMPDIAPMAGLVTLETGPQCKAVSMDWQLATRRSPVSESAVLYMRSLMDCPCIAPVLGFLFSETK